MAAGRALVVDIHLADSHSAVGSRPVGTHLTADNQVVVDIRLPVQAD